MVVSFQIIPHRNWMITAHSCNVSLKSAMEEVTEGYYTHTTVMHCKRTVGIMASYSQHKSYLWFALQHRSYGTQQTSTYTHTLYTHIVWIYVTGSEKSQLPLTQQQDTCVTIKWLTNNSDKYWCWQLPRVLLLLLVFKAWQLSTSAWVVFKWHHLPLTSRQPAVIYHMTGWEFGHGFSYFVWYVEVKMSPMDAIWLFSLRT